MADLSRLQNSSPVQLVDANDLQVCDLATAAPSGSESGLIVRNIPSGTQAVSGTVTATPTDTYTVAGTVTATPTGTYTVTGTVTANPTGTYTVAGTVTAVPSGTYTVAGTTTSTPTGTYTVALQKTSTSTLANVTVSTSTSTALLAANASRIMACFFNSDNSNFVYIKWGTTASATSYTVKLLPQGLYELPLTSYTGAVHALADTAAVTIRTTEI